MRLNLLRTLVNAMRRLALKVGWQLACIRRPGFSRSATSHLFEPLENRTLVSATMPGEGSFYSPGDEAVSTTVLHAAAFSDDSSFVDQWYLRNTGQTGGTPSSDINIADAWDATTGSRSVVVAILDSGIDLAHPDLADNIWINPGEVADDGIDNDDNGFIDDLHGWDFVDFDSDPTDDYFHGTHMAGLIGAVGDNLIDIAGVNWSVSLMPVKMLDFRGDGRIGNAAAAIDYITMMKRDFGVPVVAINASFGGIAFSQTLHDAIEAAVAEDMLFVTVAGNTGDDLDAEPRYPASEPSGRVITVAATDDEDVLTSFSSVGAMTVDLAAPGRDILSTTPTTETPGMTRNGVSANSGYLSGTSMSAALVSGTVALLKSHLPNASVDQIRDAIFASVDQLDSLATTTITGGRLNVAAAISSLDEIVNDPPVLANPGSLTVDEGSLLDIVMTATDADQPSDELTFSLEASPQGATLDASGRLQWTPTEAQGPASWQFRVRVTDSGTPALFNEVSFIVHVLEVDVAPSLSVAESVTTDQDQQLALSIGVAHVDDPSQLVTLAIDWGDGSPTEEVLLDFDQPFDITIPQTHQFDQPGRYIATIIATDIEGNDASQSVEILVNTVHFFTRAQSFSYQDSGNQRVTLRLVGPGEGRVVLPPSGLGDVMSLSLAGTTQGSSLLVRTSSDRTVFHDVTIGDTIGRVVAPTVDLAGVFNAAGGVRLLSLRDIGDAASIEIGAGEEALRPRPMVALLGRVEAVRFNVEGHVQLLRATSWARGLGSELRADSIGRMIITGDPRNAINGDFNADLVLTGASRGPTLAAAFIRGDIRSGSWSIDGDVRVVRTFGHISELILNTTGDLAAMLFRTVAQSSLNIDGNIRLLRGVTWLEGELQAYGFGSILLSGSNDSLDTFVADLSSGSEGVSIHRVIIRGLWRNSVIQTAGDVRHVNATQMSNVKLYVGVSSVAIENYQAAGAQLFQNPATLGSLVVRGWPDSNMQPAVEHSMIAASQIGVMLLRGVQADPEASFGLITESIGRYYNPVSGFSLIQANGPIVGLADGSFKLMLI